MQTEHGVQGVGTVEPEFLSPIGLLPLQNLLEQLSKTEHDGVSGWLLKGQVTAGLNALAHALHAAGLAGAWRDEQLAVCNATGQRLGTIERAAVRPLGIATQAVHLLGFAPDGRQWVQQRALFKPNDPGLWDTLMGGMVSADDALDATLMTALARETWEEAGLRLADLQELRYGGHIDTCRPARDGGGAGYLVERLDWFSCVVPDCLVPVNQDGEVTQFAQFDARTVQTMIAAGQFTDEAAWLIQAHADAHTTTFTGP